MADSLRPSEAELRELRRILMERLSRDLDRTVASLDVFYQRVDLEWRARFELNWELYGFSEELLRHENGLELEELEYLLALWAEWEEYEYCTILKEILAHYRAELAKPQYPFLPNF